MKILIADDDPVCRGLLQGLLVPWGFDVVLAVDGAARLVTHLFTGLEEPLRDAEYAGPVDVNCIVTPDAAYALEGTFRFGYDAIQTLWSLQTDSGWGEIVERCVKGTLENAHLSSDYAIGVRVTVPFPDTVLSRRKTCLAALQAAPGSTISPESMYDRLVTEQEKMVRIRRIGGFPNESVSDWVHLSAAGWDEELGCFVTAATPTDNNILTMTATGELLDVAKARVYDRLSNLELPDKQYRNDIGDRVEKDLKALKQQEWV